MERVTLRIPKEQMEEIRTLVDRGEYPNQSEAIRASIRGMLKHERRLDGLRPREVTVDAD